MEKIVYLMAIVLFLSCTSRKVTDDPVLAKVFDEALYLSDIAEVVPSGIDPHDSLQIAKSHTEKWIRDKLLLHLAEQNLSDEDKNIDKLIEDYRSSLLIFKFKQNFINQKLDTSIQELEIQEYYNNFSSNFLLSNHVVKGIFVKVPRSAKQTGKVRRWCQSNTQEHIQELEQYCYHNQAEFDYFDENWKTFGDIADKLPHRYNGYDHVLKNKWKFYETRDSTYYYFLKISDSHLEGSVSPLELVYNDLRSILINKRKLKLMQELESNVYNDALNRGYFTVYN